MLLQQLLSIHETATPSPTWRKTISRQSHPGETIEDFELLRLLGQGAFAQVFLAKQASMNRLVALKISEDCGDEPQTLSQLDHPNIVRVFDVRRLPPLRLLSMQYAPGGTLQQLVGSLAHYNLSELNGSELIINTHAGKAYVHLDNVHGFKNDVQINTGDHDDFVWARGVAVNDDFRVNTAGGADRVVLINIAAEDLRVETGSGQDHVDLFNVAALDDF